MNECRFCLLEGDPTDRNDPLLMPCNCRGSGAYVHKSCLRRWRQTDVRVDQDILCPVCLGQYNANIVNVYIREEIPEYNLDRMLRLLNSPVILTISLNYLFIFYISIIPQPYTKIVYRNCPMWFNFSNFICDERVEIVYNSDHIIFFYKSLHILLASVYFTYYLAIVANVHDWRRYVKFALREVWLPLLHLVLLRTMDHTHIVGGVIHNFLLPQYFVSHTRILRAMNADF